MATNGVHFTQTKVQKFCQDCGKLELMAPRGLFCKECRKKRERQKQTEHYLAHREEILAKMNKKKEKNKTYAQHERPKIYPVIFKCQEGRYSWEVAFVNPITGRKVLWQSAKDFETLMSAKKDFSKACGGR